MAMVKYSIWIFHISVLLFIATKYAVANLNRKDLPVSEVLNNMAFDNVTKNIFIGGDNVLLKASENLVALKRQVTGPNLDFVDCYHDFGQTCAGKVTTNINKLLLIDSSKRHLIVCGSFNHGVCQIRSLDSLKLQTNRTIYVVSRTPLQAAALITPAGKRSGTRALYVATSWDKEYFTSSDLQYITPAVSTRIIDDLNRLFDPAKDAIAANSYLQYRENVVYHAKFIYAFSAGIFNYFVSVQQTVESFTKDCKGGCSTNQSKFKTFIVRLCQEDEVYSSYMELPLDCKGSNGTSFNIAQSAYLTKAGDGLAVDASTDVLVVTFFKVDKGWSGPSQYSAVCTYSVKEIKATLVSNLQNCVNNANDEEIGLPWAGGKVRKCDDEKSNPRISENFCPTSILFGYHPFRGKTPLTKRPVMQYEKGMLTAVAAMPYYNHTVIFVGTHDGQLLKLSVEDGQQEVEPYSELKISSDEVRQIIVTSDQQHLYILSKHKVTQLPVEDCDASKSCDKCTKPNNPFCGWCTFYKRCSQKTSCPSSDAHPLRYVTNSSNCPAFASISPKQVPYGPSIELTIRVSNVPSLAGLKCFVHGKEHSTTTVGPGNELKCRTPPEKDLPSITSDNGDVFVDLALFSTESQLEFLVEKLAFYSCPAIKGCINCAEGNYTCKWCTYRGICTSNGNVDCPGEFIMPLQDRVADSNGCPQIIADKPVLVPAQVNTNFTVPAKNLPLEKDGASYKCVVTVDGSRKTSDAKRISDTELVCSPMEYKYSASNKKQEVKLEVIFRNSDVLHTPNTFKVYLYKCWVSIKDCSSCHVENDKNFQCGWCNFGVPKCVVQKACGDTGAWIPPTSLCLTRPKISKVWPLTGPVTGGTEIEIHGSDLGKTFNDIKDFVQVADIKCYPDETKYQPSKSIFCNTSNSIGPLSGAVSVTVSKIKGESNQLFSYQIPEPMDFNPKKGPRSGGTTVKITGLKMNTGRHITATVAGRKCVVDRDKVTNDSVSCTVSSTFSRRKRSAVNASTGVTVSFDGFTPTSPRGIFVFTPDPTVTSIEPDEVFFGGGLMLRITGTNLDTIQKPRMYLTYFSPNGTTKLIQDCESIRSTLITCQSPKVPNFGGNVSKVQVQFLMDAGIPLRSNHTSLTMIPDLFFKRFKDDLHVLKTENLILEGKNLQDKLREQIFVTVGRLTCKITSVDKTQLVCRVPSEESHSPQASDGLYSVKVVVGNLNFPLGNLEYFKEEESKVIPIEVWIGVGGGVLFIFIIVVIILCWNRHSRRKKSKAIKNLEVQMNNLESKVARECREAFAELQTDVTDLTSDLSNSGMPFLDFRMYALHVLFPGLGDHPVLHKHKGTLTENWEKGLRQFSQLIYNKKFLLVFIRTLESQNTFQMKDRCNVASLLMVALQAKMEYATDILKELLCELIRKSVAKSHPKLLLRRTESVAEKMLTNWLAFCMYDFLKNDAGEPLFMLFKALKQQSEKGPVDAVTGEARYSLSEDKLLRQAVDFKPLNVTVTYESNQPVTVSMLDCDTITQAKEKILDVLFKNSPYSSRPDKDDYQLEWEQSSGRVISLRNDDSKSLIEGEWRKINTLKDYEVTDGATLKLVTGQRYFCSSTDSELNKKNILRVNFSPAGSYSPLAAMNTDGPDEGGKLWHLVKQMDYPTERAEDDHNSKFLSEIYLTRLLMTKGTLQQFVDRLFHTVFMKYRRGCSLPPAVKFLFDLLDTQARELNLSDPEVLHTWKNNSLPLRFWINIIKNPNFIFDVCKSAIVDSCLSVVAQLFMDSCSVSEHVLGKDSPSNKLLYAREIPGYRQDVERFYSDIQASPAPTPQELSKFFSDFSMEHSQEFDGDSALQELYDYVRKYQDQLQDALEESELSPLASKLEHVIATISDD